MSMWRHYGNPIEVGYHVLIIEGVATPYPGLTTVSTGDIARADSGSGEGGKAWFRGGSLYDTTAAEDIILQAAGY